MELKSFAPSLPTITLLAVVVTLATSSLAQADQNRRCKKFNSSSHKNAIEMCARVQNHRKTS